KRVRRLDGAHEDRRRRGTFRRHYYRPSHAAYDRTRFGASAAGAQVHGQDYRPLGISDQGEHPSLRGAGGGHDARETLRCRRATARDGSAHEKALSADYCAPHSAGVNSGTFAIIPALILLPTDHLFSDLRTPSPAPSSLLCYFSVSVFSINR